MTNWCPAAGKPNPAGVSPPVGRRRHPVGLRRHPADRYSWHQLSSHGYSVL